MLLHELLSSLRTQVMQQYIMAGGPCKAVGSSCKNQPAAQAAGPVSRAGAVTRHLSKGLQPVSAAACKPVVVELASPGAAAVEEQPLMEPWGEGGHIPENLLARLGRDLQDSPVSGSRCHAMLQGEFVRVLTLIKRVYKTSSLDLPALQIVQLGSTTDCARFTRCGSRLADNGLCPSSLALPRPSRLVGGAWRPRILMTKS